MKEIQLTQGKFAIVDDDMYEYLSQWKWFTHRDRNTFYAERMGGKWPNRKVVRMHRAVMNVSDDVLIDHLNGNGLDNRRENLRACTISENARNRGKDRDNSTGYKGVSWHKQDQKYHAQIRVSGRKIYLGSYADPEEAARAYDKAAKELHGEFANTNF